MGAGEGMGPLVPNKNLRLTQEGRLKVLTFKQIIFQKFLS